MGKIEGFEDLEVWKQSREFAKDIYKLTGKESFSKEFRFKEQIKSSSGSIMDNIAEGFERGGNKELIQSPIHCKRLLRRNKKSIMQSLRYKSHNTR